MFVVGGLIVGNPDDARVDRANLAFARGTSTGRTSSTRRRIPARR
jgi:hypothetical protein